MHGCKLPAKSIWSLSKTFISNPTNVISSETSVTMILFIILNTSYMCVYVYIFIFICLYIYICSYLYMFVCVYICILHGIVCNRGFYALHTRGP